MKIVLLSYPSLKCYFIFNTLSQRESVVQGMISQQYQERDVFKTRERERRRHKLASPSIALNMHLLPYPVCDLLLC